MKIVTVFFLFFYLIHPVQATSSTGLSIKDPFLAEITTNPASIITFPTLYEDSQSAVFQFTTTTSPLIACNPKNFNKIICAMNQTPSLYLDATSATLRLFHMQHLDVAIFFSEDGGKSWNTSTIPLNITLGGNVSDAVTLSSIGWSADGHKALLAGRFADIRTGIKEREHPLSGIWIAESSDGGQTWKEQIISTMPSDAQEGSETIADAAPKIACDPILHHHIYAAWHRPHYVTTESSGTPQPLYGNVFCCKSTTADTTFSPPYQIYDIQKDLGVNGLCSAVALCTTTDGDKSKTVVASFMRTYPSSSGTVYDRAIIYSDDHGETWSEKPFSLAPFTFAQEYIPSQAIPALAYSPALDGSESSHMVQSKKTGRLYLLFQAGSLHTQKSKIAKSHPDIVLSVSEDFGKKWSSPVPISQTYDAIKKAGKQPFDSTSYQAFNGSLCWMAPDMIGIFYYDHRNYIDHTSFAATDAWLALYRETDDAHGGSTGIGLDFVSEYRLTEDSFDAALIQTGSYITGGFGHTSGLDATADHFLCAYSSVGTIQKPSSECFTANNENFCAYIDTSEHMKTNFKKIEVK